MPREDQILDALLNDRSIAEAVVDNRNEAATTVEPPQAETETATIAEKAAENPTEVKVPEQAAETPVSWIEEASKRIGMEFTTEDELKNFFAKAKGYDELETRSSTLNQELEKYKAEANPFANDHIKKLNELIKGGASDQQIKLFNEIDSIGEIKTLSHVEAKKLALRYEHDLTPEQAETMIKSTYKLDEELYDKETVEAEKIRLKIDSQKDFQYLTELQTKASENPALAKEEDYKAKIADYTKQVLPVAKSIQDSLTALKGVNLNGKQGTDAFITDLPVSEETRSKIADLATQYAVTNQIPLDEAGQANIREFAANVALIADWKNMAVHIASKTEERIRAEFHNPSSIQRGPDSPAADGKALREQEILNQVLNS